MTTSFLVTTHEVPWHTQYVHCQNLPNAVQQIIHMLLPYAMRYTKYLDVVYCILYDTELYKHVLQIRPCQTNGLSPDDSMMTMSWQAQSRPVAPLCLHILYWCCWSQGHSPGPSQARSYIYAPGPPTTTHTQLQLSQSPCNRGVCLHTVLQPRLAAKQRWSATTGTFMPFRLQLERACSHPERLTGLKLCM